MQLQNSIASIIEKNISPEAFEWLQKQGTAIKQEVAARELNISFTAVPRKTGKNKIHLSEAEIEQLQPLVIQDWTIDKLCRVWLLMQVDTGDKAVYIKKIKTLFSSAEMNELIALYAALPVQAYPEEWKLQCAEGIRSNIGLVLETIMYNNPYPAANLDEAAWNQLVLKAFFTDKDVNLIIGLDERANRNLANILVDYAHERWAAHRPVNVQLWRLVGKFIEEHNIADIKKLFESRTYPDQEAAALACFDSNYEPAKVLLNQFPNLKSAIEGNKLNWKTLGKQKNL